MIVEEVDVDEAVRQPERVTIQSVIEAGVLAYHEGRAIHESAPYTYDPVMGLAFRYGWLTARVGELERECSFHPMPGRKFDDARLFLPGQPLAHPDKAAFGVQVAMLSSGIQMCARSRSAMDWVPNGTLYGLPSDVAARIAVELLTQEREA